MQSKLNEILLLCSEKSNEETTYNLETSHDSSLVTITRYYKGRRNVKMSGNVEAILNFIRNE